ncbi:MULTISPECIES: DMT family transporter [unclassified Vibrio]|uniref:DMT family transporter n=2 Tax=Vibrio TaxID=662 RepID=UPI00137356AC|nr:MULTISPECIES: multidrug efflux SMR transporter [unclassified Vibrio]NAW68644.1 QacE family quaternary ammonium compound efflux SMR transporter [Vibrio sp. V28_P6S34P95]NAX04787.1 QacE family quaternary ammonium compound efflux SMR transporter [Vibrio sp. V30_P3S12P165]NAX38306.1 QacE family quaternary ammonium compound efflux SMR transporter [Vibrio sp. V27_P1S3P104]NAX39214.1 QacE family quaternary ammonium compound efflux SMR transporter [Vibrio sp. V26_P1S5P106]NNN43816.1 multidrug efflu
MAWLILFIAGLSEVAWAAGLKYTEGFSKPVASILTLACLVLSFVLLGLSLKTLPLGVAYSVWVGIGVVGTAIVGLVFWGEPVSMVKIASLGLIVLGIIGMKFAS